MATVVAVFAHPDDETFICGGSLARLAAEGHRIVLVCATRGEMGRRMGVPPSATRESIGDVRELELRAACDALGIAELCLLGIRDKSLEIQPFDDLVARILDVLHREQPTSVITFHEQYGGHPDHCTIGRAATTAFTAYRRNRAQATLYFTAWSHMFHEARSLGLPKERFVQVDVSDHSLAKLRAFRAHRTQSQMNESIWRDDQSSASRMGGYEYFLQAFAPYQADMTALVD